MYRLKSRSFSIINYLVKVICLSVFLIFSISNFTVGNSYGETKWVLEDEVKYRLSIGLSLFYGGDWEVYGARIGEPFFKETIYEFKEPCKIVSVEACTLRDFMKLKETGVKTSTYLNTDIPYSEIDNYIATINNIEFKNNEDENNISRRIKCSYTIIPNENQGRDIIKDCYLKKEAGVRIKNFKDYIFEPLGGVESAQKNSPKVALGINDIIDRVYANKLSYNGNKKARYYYTPILIAYRQYVKKDEPEEDDESEYFCDAEINTESPIYEGHWGKAEDHSSFRIDDEKYSAEEAYLENKARNTFSLKDKSKKMGELKRSKKHKDFARVRFYKPDTYNVDLRVSCGSATDNDIDSVNVIKTPDITSEIKGEFRSNRRLDLKFKTPANEFKYKDKYESDFYENEIAEYRVDIITEDLETCTVKDNGLPSKTPRIKTRKLEVTEETVENDGKWIYGELPFLVETEKSLDLKYKITLTDIYGNKASSSGDFHIEPDLPPVPVIDFADEYYRKKGGGNAEINLRSKSQSDGDELKLFWSISKDEKLDGNFSPYINAQNLLNYKNTAFGTNKKIRFEDKYVGDFKIKLKAQDIWTGETLPEYIDEDDYKKAEIIVGSKVENAPPKISLDMKDSRNVNFLLLSNGKENTKELRNLVKTKLKGMKNKLETEGINLFIKDVTFGKYNRSIEKRESIPDVNRYSRVGKIVNDKIIVANDITKKGDKETHYKISCFDTETLKKEYDKFFTNKEVDIDGMYVYHSENGKYFILSDIKPENNEDSEYNNGTSIGNFRSKCYNNNFVDKKLTILDRKTGDFLTHCKIKARYWYGFEYLGDNDKYIYILSGNNIYEVDVESGSVHLIYTTEEENEHFTKLNRLQKLDVQGGNVVIGSYIGEWVTERRKARKKREYCYGKNGVWDKVVLNINTGNITVERMKTNLNSRRGISAIINNGNLIEEGIGSIVYGKNGEVKAEVSMFSKKNKKKKQRFLANVNYEGKLYKYQAGKKNYKGKTGTAVGYTYENENQVISYGVDDLKLTFDKNTKEIESSLGVQAIRQDKISLGYDITDDGIFGKQRVDRVPNRLIDNIKDRLYKYVDNSKGIMNYVMILDNNNDIAENEARELKAYLSNKFVKTLSMGKGEYLKEFNKIKQEDLEKFISTNIDENRDKFNMLDLNAKEDSRIEIEVDKKDGEYEFEYEIELEDGNSKNINVYEGYKSDEIIGVATLKFDSENSDVSFWDKRFEYLNYYRGAGNISLKNQPTRFQFYDNDKNKGKEYLMPLEHIELLGYKFVNPKDCIESKNSKYTDSGLLKIGSNPNRKTRISFELPKGTKGDISFDFSAFKKFEHYSDFYYFQNSKGMIWKIRKDNFTKFFYNNSGHNKDNTHYFWTEEYCPRKEFLEKVNTALLGEDKSKWSENRKFLIRKYLKENSPLGSTNIDGKKIEPRIDENLVEAISNQWDKLFVGAETYNEKSKSVYVMFRRPEIENLISQQYIVLKGNQTSKIGEGKHFIEFSPTAPALYDNLKVVIKSEKKIDLQDEKIHCRADKKSGESTLIKGKVFTKSQGYKHNFVIDLKKGKYSISSIKIFKKDNKGNKYYILNKHFNSSDDIKSTSLNPVKFKINDNIQARVLAKGKQKEKEDKLIYEKGELVSYDLKYTDYENDPKHQKDKYWVLVHEPFNDGANENASIIEDFVGGIELLNGKEPIKFVKDVLGCDYDNAKNFILNKTANELVENTKSLNLNHKNSLVKVLKNPPKRFYKDGKYTMYHWVKDDVSRGKADYIYNKIGYDEKKNWNKYYETVENLKKQLEKKNGKGTGYNREGKWIKGENLNLWNKISNLGEIVFFVEGGEVIEKENHIPKVEFIITEPKKISEQNDVSLKIKVSDKDFDVLDVKTEIYFKRKLIYKDLQQGLEPDNKGDYDIIFLKKALKKVKCGKYKVVVTVSDGKSVGLGTHTFEVLTGYKIFGKVYHTEKWEENRKRYNLKHFDDEINEIIDFKKYSKLSKPRKRYRNVYWSGEKFQLKSWVSGNPIRVKCRIIGENFKTELKRSSLILKNPKGFDSVLYTGNLWDKQMMYRWGNKKPEEVKFEFEAIYENGEKRKSYTSIIVDNTDLAWKLHRKY